MTRMDQPRSWLLALARRGSTMAAPRTPSTLALKDLFSHIFSSFFPWLTCLVTHFLAFANSLSSSLLFFFSSCSRPHFSFVLGFGFSWVSVGLAYTLYTTQLSYQSSPIFLLTAMIRYPTTRYRNILLTPSLISSFELNREREKTRVLIIVPKSVEWDGELLPTDDDDTSRTNLLQSLPSNNTSRSTLLVPGSNHVTCHLTIPWDP